MFVAIGYEGHSEIAVTRRVFIFFIFIYLWIYSSVRFVIVLKFQVLCYFDFDEMELWVLSLVAVWIDFRSLSMKHRQVHVTGYDNGNSLRKLKLNVTTCVSDSMSLCGIWQTDTNINWTRVRHVTHLWFGVSGLHRSLLECHFSSEIKDCLIQIIKKNDFYAQ